MIIFLIYGIGLLLGAVGFISYMAYLNQTAYFDIFDYLLDYFWMPIALIIWPIWLVGWLVWKTANVVIGVWHRNLS